MSLRAQDETDILGRLRASGLRGRGGAWFPAWRKWQAVLAEGGQPFVVANGGEGEPGSLKDRLVMLTRPAAVLRGLVTAARALGARDACVYLKGSFQGPHAALESALREVDTDGLRLVLHRGEDSYVSGEETALLESLEGRRAWPRPKPPLPAAVGYQGRPTLVQNVETLSRVPDAIADPEGFRLRETTLVTVWGHVKSPGVFEVPLGTPLRRIIDEQAGGALDGIGLLFPAGPSAAPLAADGADTPLDPDALRAAGSGLGTASILVLGQRACPVAAAASAASFFERASCGQCPPCSLGSASLARVVRGLETGASRPRDLQSLGQVAAFMSGHGYCAHGRTGAAVVSALVARFGSEVEEHLVAGGCPHPQGAVDPFHPDSPENAALADRGLVLSAS